MSVRPSAWNGTTLLPPDGCWRGFALGMLIKICRQILLSVELMLHDDRRTFISNAVTDVAIGFMGTKNTKFAWSL